MWTLWQSCARAHFLPALHANIQTKNSRHCKVHGRHTTIIALLCHKCIRLISNKISNTSPNLRNYFWLCICFSVFYKKVIILLKITCSWLHFIHLPGLSGGAGTEQRVVGCSCRSCIVHCRAVAAHWLSLSLSAKIIKKRTMPSTRSQVRKSA